MKSKRLLMIISSGKIVRGLRRYQAVGRSGCGSGGKGKCAGAGAWLLARRAGLCGGVLSNRHVRWQNLRLRAVLKLVSLYRKLKWKTNIRHVMFTYKCTGMVKG